METREPSAEKQAACKTELQLQRPGASGKSALCLHLHCSIWKSDPEKGQSDQIKIVWISDTLVKWLIVFQRSCVWFWNKRFITSKCNRLRNKNEYEHQLFSRSFFISGLMSFWNSHYQKGGRLIIYERYKGPEGLWIWWILSNFFALFFVFCCFVTFF